MFKALKNALLTEFMNSRLFSFIVLRILPYMRFSNYYTDIRGWTYKRGYRLLRPGDIILSTDRHKLLSYMVPGDFAHAALCVDKGGDVEFEVAEMTKSHFTRSTFYDVCKEADIVVILRCLDWDPAYVRKVIEKCRSFEGVQYDVTFSPETDKLYCPQLITASDVENRLDVQPDALPFLGRPYVSPTCLYEAANVEVIWDSRLESEEHESKIISIGGGARSFERREAPDEESAASR